MTSLLFRRGRTAAAALAVLVAGAAGCKSDRATVFEPFGANSYDFHLTNAASVAAAGLPQGTVTIIKRLTANDTVRVDLNHLHTLTSGVYQVWIADTSGGAVTNVVPLVGRVRVITTHADATTDTVNTDNVSSFSAGGANVAVRLTANTASFGSNPAALAHRAIFVTIESAAGATTPSDLRPLWTTYKGVAPDTTTRPATPPATGTVQDTATRKVVTSSFNFGSFTGTFADSYVYFINGHGEGGVRASTLIVDDTALARPPKGYFYGAFLVSGDGADTVYLGELTAPFPRRNVSLRDADVNLVDPVVEVSPPVLRFSSILWDASKAGRSGTLPFEGLDNFYISLLLKQGVANELPPNIVTSGTLPDIVTTAPATGT